MHPASFARRARTTSWSLALTLASLAGSSDDVRAQGTLLPGGSAELVLTGNEFQCNLDNEAGICHALSPTIPGAVWPSGSSNAYIFNSGLIVAALIGPDGGLWAGDTVGSPFFNRNGGSIATPITNLWNSLDPDDLSDWP